MRVPLGAMSLCLAVAGQSGPQSAPPPFVISLSTPGNGAVVTTTIPSLSWTDARPERNYRVQISARADFGAIAYETILDRNTISIQVPPGTLARDTT